MLNRRGIVALLLVNAILAGLIWLSWSATSDLPALPPGAKALRTSLPAVEGVTRQGDTRTAQLFASVTDSPKPAPAPRPTPEAGQNLRLIGVMMPEAGTGNEPPIALVEYGAPRRMLRLRPGDAVQDLGLRVLSIQRDRVEFQAGEGRLLKKLQ